MGSRNVLIAHESKSIRNCLKSYVLSEMDERIVYEAFSAKDALLLCRQMQFGVFICSGELPGVESSALYRKVRELMGSRECPFILVTTNNTTWNLKSLSEQGIPHYLVYPFTAKELRNKINAVCDLRRHRVYDRIHVPDVKAYVHVEQEAAEGDVVNLSVDGIACDFEWTGKHARLLENNGITLRFSSEHNNVQISRLPCKFVRFTVLTWKTNLTPGVVRLALRFVGLSLHPQHLRTLKQIIETTKKGFCLHP